MQKINELTDYLKEVELKNSFPLNFNNYVEIFADELKFSKEHLSPENFENNIRDLKIDFNLKNQVNANFLHYLKKKS